MPGTPTPPDDVYALSVLDGQDSSTVLVPEPGQQGELSVQELPPIDGGKKAWIFCASAFFLELMVWGFGFR